MTMNSWQSAILVATMARLPEPSRASGRATRNRRKRKKNPKSNNA